MHQRDGQLAKNEAAKKPLIAKRKLNKTEILNENVTKNDLRSVS